MHESYACVIKDGIDVEIHDIQLCRQLDPANPKLTPIRLKPAFNVWNWSHRCDSLRVDVSMTFGILVQMSTLRLPPLCMGTTHILLDVPKVRGLPKSWNIPI